MRGMFDFSSWSALASTVLSLLLITLMMVGVRLLFMQTIQKRRERENRQINERLRTLMAAYKTLGGSFTGNLTVSPLHLREARSMTQAGEASAEHFADTVPMDADDHSRVTGASSERQRRTRDAVEAALSDIILLGTEEQVRMAAQAAQDMVAGRPVHTAALVTSLRQFIRAALYLDSIPNDVAIPSQGPLRPHTTAGPGARRNAAPDSNPPSGGRGGAAGSQAAGAGGGMGLGLGISTRRSDEPL